MYIVMHCGGMPFNGNTIKEQSLGGSETAAYYVAKELAQAGHSVTIFTAHREGGVFDGVKYEWMGEASEEVPLGQRFMFYAENTPHDILIIQRHPRAFAYKFASKLNFWWLHDLALKRNQGIVNEHMWNIDRILCVSEFHKNQICSTWDLPRDIVSVVRNGIDLTLFDSDVEYLLPTKYGAKLFYSSRPERGLVNLLMEGGIMDQLRGEPFHLYVCAYQNTVPQMSELYEYLDRRCRELPNVTNIGALTKKQLADAMRQADALVYPTTFEEVSCITAMEAMAAGLPFIASEYAALPETCKDSGAQLIPLKDGEADIPEFLEAIRENGQRSYMTAKLQRAAAEKYQWKFSAKAILETAMEAFRSSDGLSLAHHFMRHSDIPALEHVLSPAEEYMTKDGEASAMETALRTELNIGYEFYRDKNYADHYKRYYEYEKSRGVKYGPEDVSNTSRFRAVAGIVDKLPTGSVVLDYGCAHGHYTVNLAKQRPDLVFVGVDLAQSNIDTATKWAKDEGLTNTTFKQGDHTTVGGDVRYDCIIAAEVVEHVGDPQELVDALGDHLTDNGIMILTTPYGPWEAQGYREHGYWRAHLHHFERADLHEMFGEHKNYHIIACPSGFSKFDSPLGSYIVTFGKPTKPSGRINYRRKIAQTMPDQTISVCMIAKDAEADIIRCLNSVVPYVQEVIIGVDATTTDRTRARLAEYAQANPLVGFNVFTLEQVTMTGFAAARNATIEHASGDWILWIDTDEVLIHGERMARYTRNNLYGAYAMRQHHLSLDPMQVLKVDLPCRLFRNRKGVKFFGYVHEHPELKMNEGIGQVALIPGVELAHHGYTDEPVRRKRFGRNIGLMKRDRVENPDRVLGKFLWIRDLAQACQYDYESGNVNPDEFNRRADEGIALWESLLESKNNRITIDALPYYSVLVEIKGGGFDFGFTVDASKLNGGAHPEKQQPVSGKFLNKEHAYRLLELVAQEKTAGFESRYF